MNSHCRPSDPWGIGRIGTFLERPGLTWLAVAMALAIVGLAGRYVRDRVAA